MRKHLGIGGLAHLLLSSAHTTTDEGAPPFAVFEGWAARTSSSMVIRQHTGRAGGPSFPFIAKAWGSRTFSRYRFLRILIHSTPRLPPQPPRFDVLHQQRRRTIFLS